MFVCVCVTGESGLGKSTLVNSLFLTDLHKDRKLLNAEGESPAGHRLLCADETLRLWWTSAGSFWPKERISQTVEITKHTVDIEEKGVKLKLTIVDTPGFGDAVNNTEWWASWCSCPFFSAISGHLNKYLTKYLINKYLTKYLFVLICFP